ncbi:MULTISPECIES: TonB-dependent receptor [unclassified Duganella]|uniref:TonB-dependent receptor family protein n=1 Tax=unclassified Duganella TaxID=2636909 RepID=UPI000700C4D2|nr:MULTISPECIES: TonB-dependent receptor [unclassified Duganella]KQV51912.1 TonB-dependent receptor [Duganella sp. Root336D2]KRB88440.1 TonB-dependent receptor [Duganella sp. Root198D2]
MPYIQIPEQLPIVVVSATRSERASFDVPAAIDVLGAGRIHEGQPRVNASEALAAVPGLVVQNRQNYAQDLQISSRGFGARSAFGVRGVRLIADGIPASMPDGQGQAATFNLDMAERIEVLRGPFSALYGNHSGGVIQLFTREGKGRPTLETSSSAGSDGLQKIDMSAQGKADGVGYALDASRFQTDGFRNHSAATREQAHAKLNMHVGGGGKLTLVATGLRQKATQDPLGVTWATWQLDPRAGETDATDTLAPKRTLAERYDTRKSINHQQAGITWEQPIGDARLLLAAYTGNRRVVQYQSFSRGFQAPATHSGGVVDFDRDFHGGEVRWQSVLRLANGMLTTSAGVEYGAATDDRKGYENFSGTTLGVKGRLRRDEDDSVSNVDPYAQAEWQEERWQVTAGLRRSRISVSVTDRFTSNGDDSGKLRFSQVTPLAAVLYHATPSLNFYVSAARGFEAPTLNELFYSGGGAGFNFNLRPARSKHVEGGAKAILAPGARIDAALFEIRTSDELIVDSSVGGRTSYRNAARTVRKGVEMSFDTAWGAGFSSRIALTSLRATYENGAHLPGVARAYGFGELAWRESGGRWGAALEGVASAKVYAEDSNTERAAPGYGLLNLRLTAVQAGAEWRVSEYVRLNNLAGKQYVGSVIVGDANKRYYEGAPGRNWVAGVSARYQF